MQNGCSPIQVGGYQMIRIRPSEEVEKPSLLYGVRILDVNIWVEIGGGRVQIGGSRVQMAAAGYKLATAGCNSYPDMWSGRPPMVYPDALSGYTPCMDSKELSSISNLLW